MKNKIICGICSKETPKSENYIEIVKGYYICEKCFNEVLNIKEVKNDTKRIQRTPKNSISK
ncbi:MAG: hypothetical protein QXG39_03430 [Candidatus Aenigmatarchaeota archaeon]